MKHHDGVGLYIIFDNKAQAPAGNYAYYFRHPAAAVRFFIDCLTTNDTHTLQHQEDYDLYLIAEIQADDKGPLTALREELIMTGKAAKASLDAAQQPETY